MEVEKTDADTGVKLEGATFAVYAKGEIALAGAKADGSGTSGLGGALEGANTVWTGTGTSGLGGALDAIGAVGALSAIPGDTIVRTATSGADGVAVFLDLPPGTYYVREVKAPQDYEINEEFAPAVTLAYGTDDADGAGAGGTDGKGGTASGQKTTVTVYCADKRIPPEVPEEPVPEKPARPRLLSPGPVMNAPVQTPKTGDGFPLLALLLCLVPAAGCLVVLYLSRWRFRRDS
jgi:uncharacterized surface anchored protein